MIKAHEVWAQCVEKAEANWRTHKKIQKVKGKETKQIQNIGLLKVEKENRHVLDSQRILFGLAIFYLVGTFHS